jgi:sarcosine oxidase, subunit beta
MKDCSTIIIGGGIAGTSIAFHLSSLGGERGVVLLEKGTLASGSSSKSDGIVERQLFTEFDIMLRVKSFEILRAFFEDKVVDFRPIGYVRMTSSEDEMARFGESVRIQNRLGVKDSRVIYPDEIKRLMPFMDVSDIEGALYGPSDGMTDGSQLTGAFAGEAANRGVEVLQNTKVTAISRKGDKYEVTTDSGGMTAKNVVDASGAWAGGVASFLGLDVPVKPVRRQIVQLGVSVPNAEEIPFFIDMKTRLYMHGTGTPGMVLAGIHDDMAVESEAPADPDGYNPGVDGEFIERLAEAIASRAPGLAGGSLRGGWAGLYEVTPDSRPIIDELPDAPGFFVCAGFSGYGIQLAPIAGKLAAELITDGRMSSVDDAAPLSSRRFHGAGGYSLF